MESKHTDVFDLYARYYDLFYRDKNYEAEAVYVDKLLRRFGVTGGDLLEFGSGTGKHGRLLGERGYRVFGIERSAEMVARATATAGFQSKQGDIRETRLGRTFSAVLSLFHVVSYQVTNDDARAVFVRAREHLEKGGLFIFDVWYAPAVFAQRPEVRIKRFSDGALQFTRLAEPVHVVNENRVDVQYTIIAQDTDSGRCETFKEIHPMRYFSLPEIDLLAADAGFERIGAEEFLSGAAPGESAWGVCIILRRV